MLKLSKENAVKSGDLDDKDYDHVNISRFVFDNRRKSISISFEMGSVDEEGEFLPGIKQDHLTISGDEFLEFAANSMPLENESIFQATKRALYAVLVEKGLVIDGELI